MASTSSGIHAICDDYVDDLVAHDPNMATYLGVPGQNDTLTGYSPEFHAARYESRARAIADARATEAGDDTEQIAKDVFLERLGVDQELHERGLDVSQLNVIASPVQEIRQIFDLTPSETPEDWAVIARRMAAVPGALEAIKSSLRHAAERGDVAAVRQVGKVARQCETWSGVHGDSPFFSRLAARAPEPSAALRADLDAGASAASQAYAELARFLREELAPKAPEKDAVGEDTYRAWSRYFLGADVDPREAYEWGWQEYLSIEAEAKEVAGRINPGGTLAETAAMLDAEPKYQVKGRTEYEQWMQSLSDRALADLRGTHFDIPDELMRLDCRIAPPGGGVGAYYTSPTDDFSRPGTMWWSVQADKELFSTWREVTTVYHEGVPGHHLQIATAVHQAARLNKFQRLCCFISGHGEGWALYAERLMRELGYLDDAQLLGMLDAQLFRAARVVVDNGMHLELEIPKGTGFHEGEKWTPELGLEFMLTRTITAEDHVRDEIDRYLGWPGQAPSYKLGERLWLAAREDARTRKGADFDSREFHTAALRMGTVGLDALRDLLAKV